MPDQLRQTFAGSGTYIVSEPLMEAVNIAIALKKPLLLKGEPGTGKTMLAQAIAEALGLRLLIWNIKSTTKAQEALYQMCIRDRVRKVRASKGRMPDNVRWRRLPG